MWRACYECGKLLAKRDDAQPEVVAGIPRSGIAHAIGYANESGVVAVPSSKYTPHGRAPSCPRTRARET